MAGDQGRLMRVEALPKGDPNDNDNLRKFAGCGAGGGAERDRRAVPILISPASPHPPPSSGTSVSKHVG